MNAFLPPKLNLVLKNFALLIALIPIHLSAQELTILVPYAARSAVDVATRALASNMAIKFPSGVRVENKLGESGLLGLREFAEKSSIDSSLILLNSNTFLLAAAKEPRLLEAIRPVSLIALSPMALISNKPWSSLVAESTSHKSITIGISTPGSPSHLCALQIAEAIGVRPNLVVYKGIAPLLVDLIYKKIEYACLEMSANVPMWISEGKISAAAISADEAIDTLPNVPTFESLGIKNITKGQWSILASLEKSSAKFNVDSANAIRVALQGKLNIPNGLFNFVPAEAVSNENAVNFVQRDFARTKPYLSRLVN